jgi:small subunit ribosomal protein S20
MPNHKSAIKRVKQTKKRNLRNTSNVSAMKTFMKKFISAAESKDMDNIEKLFKINVAFIMKLASKHVIHKNNAARKVSKITKLYNSVKSVQA